MNNIRYLSDYRPSQAITEPYNVRLELDQLSIQAESLAARIEYLIYLAENFNNGDIYETF